MIVTIKRPLPLLGFWNSPKIVIDDLTVQEARVLQRLMSTNMSVPDLLLEKRVLKTASDISLLSTLMDDLADALTRLKSSVE